MPKLKIRHSPAYSSGRVTYTVKGHGVRQENVFQRLQHEMVKVKMRTPEDTRREGLNRMKKFSERFPDAL